MQRFYNLNLDRMGEDYSAEHAAACIACLPMDSALFARVNPTCKLLLKDLPVKALTDALTRNKGTEDVEYGSMPVEDFDRWLKSKEA